MTKETYEYDYHHCYNFCFAKTDREKVFKIGQPLFQELASISHCIVSAWRPLGMMLGLTDMTLIEIDEANHQVSDKVYAVLGKWRESLGFEATYVALADGLDNAFIKRHELVRRYCHDKGKWFKLKEQLCIFNLTQPSLIADAKPKWTLEANQARPPAACHEESPRSAHLRKQRKSSLSQKPWLRQS